MIGQRWPSLPGGLFCSSTAHLVWILDYNKTILAYGRGSKIIFFRELWGALKPAALYLTHFACCACSFVRYNPSPLLYITCRRACRPCTTSYLICTQQRTKLCFHERSLITRSLMVKYFPVSVVALRFSVVSLETMLLIMPTSLNNITIKKKECNREKDRRDVTKDCI